MMNVKDKIALRVIEFYATCSDAWKQTEHTQKVVSYTRLIAAGEGLDEKSINLQEMGAWLHDIGCPRSYELYGNTLPVNQQKEGRMLTEMWLAGEPALADSEKEWLADVVGTHHQLASAVSLGFMPLFEADLIVNLLEGYYPLERSASLYDKMMATETGKKLFRLLIKT